jgi:hypothetical protein
MFAKQKIDFAVALFLFIALTMTAVFWTTRHINPGRLGVDPVKFGSF